MKARELINGASFEPDTVQATDQAFADPWARIARMFCNIEIETSRVRLAEAKLSVAPEGGTQ
jgi:hypothetical protein